jgi:two-component system, sensor histidine kinase and response regulator
VIVNEEAVVPETTNGQTIEGKILIVEESVLLCEMLRGLLVAAGYEVETIHEAQEAIDNITSLKPDLIFINTQIPKVDAIMAAKVMRAMLSDAALQIIFLVKQSELIDFQDMFDEGIDDYILLPFGHDELVARVKRKFAIRSGLRKEKDQVRLDTMSQVMITIAHHINNAITSLSARAHITNKNNPEDVQVLVDLTRKQTKKIGGVVESLVEMARNRDLNSTQYIEGGSQMFDIARRLEDKIGEPVKP